MVDKLRVSRCRNGHKIARYNAGNNYTCISCKNTIKKNSWVLRCNECNDDEVDRYCASCGGCFCYGTLFQVMSMDGSIHEKVLEALKVGDMIFTYP